METNHLMIISAIFVAASALILARRIFCKKKTSHTSTLTFGSHNYGVVSGQSNMLDEKDEMLSKISAHDICAFQKLAIPNTKYLIAKPGNAEMFTLKDNKGVFWAVGTAANKSNTTDCLLSYGLYIKPSLNFRATHFDHIKEDASTTKGCIIVYGELFNKYKVAFVTCTGICQDQASMHPAMMEKIYAAIMGAHLDFFLILGDFDISFVTPNLGELQKKTQAAKANHILTSLAIQSYAVSTDSTKNVPEFSGVVQLP